MTRSFFLIRKYPLLNLYMLIKKIFLYLNKYKFKKHFFNLPLSEDLAPSILRRQSLKKAFALCVCLRDSRQLPIYACLEFDYPKFLIFF